MACNTGGPAYPRPASIDNTTGSAVGPQSGMSLLDYYIGQALEGVLSNTIETNSMGLQILMGDTRRAIEQMGRGVVAMAVATLHARNEYLKQHEVTRVGDEHRGTQVADPPQVPQVPPPAG